MDHGGGAHPLSTGALQDWVDRSPRQLQQRRQADALFGSAVQRAPKDPVPALSEQLENRMVLRGEESPFPTEPQLIDELDGLLFAVNAPTVYAGAADLAAKAMADYSFSNSRAHVTDLSVLRGVLVMGALVEQTQQAALAHLTPTQIESAVAAALTPLIRTAVADWCRRDNHPVPTDAAIDASFQFGNAAVAAHGNAARFLADHPANVGFTGELSAQQTKDLARALRDMAPVKRALEGNHSDAARIKSQHFVPVRNWLNPTIKVDDESLIEEDDNELLMRENYVPGSSRDQIGLACITIASLVEQNVLANIRQPVIYVHVAKTRTLLEKIQARDFSSAKKLRAYSDSDEYEKAIHIDQSDKVDVIVHEIGHQLEDQLSTSTWLDIQRLLRGRHDLAVQRGAADEQVAIYPTHKDPEVRKESAYQAQMPATGVYSAKVYGGAGATEVMSRSLEFLASPGNAEKLIRDDPLQAAIILRGIAPDEFKSNVPDTLRALLPS